MNELQKTELQILKTFISICEKLGIGYYLVCGSALGAAKYGGFIPWDDDIDAALLRPDYELFCKNAPQMLPEHLFLQNYVTESACPFLYSKIRNSDTTFIEKATAHLDINHGIFIDVFPLDGYPEEKLRRLALERKKKTLKLKNDCAYAHDDKIKAASRLCFAAERYLGFDKKTAETNNKLTKLISAYPPETSALWCNHGNWQGKLEYAPREQYGRGRKAGFEGIEVTIPEDIDAYLTQKYGDWRSDLPESKQKGHEPLICDTARPYTYYVEKFKR